MSFGGDLVTVVIVLFLSVIMLALWINRLGCLQYRSIKEQWDYSHQVRVSGIFISLQRVGNSRPMEELVKIRQIEIERRELRKERTEFTLRVKSNCCSAGPFSLSHGRDFWFSKVMLDELNGTVQYHIPHETVADYTAFLDFKFL